MAATATTNVATTIANDHHNDNSNLLAAQIVAERVSAAPTLLVFEVASLCNKVLDVAIPAVYRRGESEVIDRAQETAAQAPD